MKDSNNEAKNYYVYLLYDTQTKEIFYVGKGKGTRFLDHLKEAQKNGDLSVENKKVDKIRQIGEKRFGCTILRQNLNQEEAYQVEAATIDLLRSASYRNIKGQILNIQSGHGSMTNGIVDIKQYRTMRNKYVQLLKSETLLSLNLRIGEYINSASLLQLVHKKKWKVREEEARKATYTVVECDNVVVAVFKSDCWKATTDGKACIFNGNQMSQSSPMLERLISHKLPKRKQGTSQARYLNYTDIQNAKCSK